MTWPEWVDDIRMEAMTRKGFEKRIRELEAQLAEARKQRDNALANCASYRNQAEESTHIAEGLMDRLEEKEARALAAEQERDEAQACVGKITRIMYAARGQPVADGTIIVASYESRVALVELTIADIRKERDRLRDALRERVDRCAEALDALVKLKDHKDIHGKDEAYKVLQPRLWSNARTALAALPTGEPARGERDACPYPDCNRGSCIGCEHDRFGEE